MKDFLVQSQYFAVVISLLGFWLGLQLKKKSPLCNPLLLAIIFVMALLVLCDISYETYYASGKQLSYLLTPATVCLALPLYQQINQFKDHWQGILCGIFAGVCCNVGMIFSMSRFFHLDYPLFVTLLPKSITTAIGLSLSEEYGGMVSITAAAIIVTGILGNLCGEFVLAQVKNPVAKGVAMGTAAHAIGTSKAMEMGEVEGAMSSLSIVLTGLFTLVAVAVLARFY